MKTRILIVDDEEAIGEALSDLLRSENFDVRIGRNAHDFLAQARAWKPDLVLLDINMPGPMSGLDALRLLRRESDVPVILISARSGDVNKALGLEYADDYLVKPFSNIELLARIRAVLRRAGGTSSRAEDEAQRFQAGELLVDLETHTASYAGLPLTLTAIEFRILASLARRPGRVLSRDDLIDQVWGEGTYITPHTLDVHISSLRRKLEPDPAHPRHLQTVRAVGFRYVASPEEL